MRLKDFISDTYPKVGPFVGTNSVEDILLEYHYLVIMDDNNRFQGMLTAADILRRPHNLVIDCVSEKVCLNIDESITSTIDKFHSSKSYALAVMDGDEFVGVVEENKLLRELENKVKDLYEKSIISEKTKKCFLNNLSHEIRTPLNGILGFLEVLHQLDTEKASAEYIEYSDIVRGTANHFLNSMNDLVELSVLDAGDEVIVERTNVCIDKILSELLACFDDMLLLQNKKVDIKRLYGDNSIVVYTDEKKLRSIIYHLFNNAIKFTSDGCVTYGFEIDENRSGTRIFIKNKCSELSQNCIQKMFGVFEKQDTIGKELNSGLGIGLPLINRLSALIGVHLDVNIEDDEVEFQVFLPLNLSVIDEICDYSPHA